MAVAVSKRSRLLFADLLKVDGVEFWDALDLPTYKSRGNDSFYRVQSADRIDLLAYRYYGAPELWWVIAWANNLDILPTELVEGMDIVIPDPTYVNSLFARAKR